jgi:hypothetical protein
MTAIVIPNVFLPSTTISSTAMNANFTTVANAIQASLAIDGSVAMTGALKGANGTAALPAFSFNTDPNIGMYRKAADELGFATNGVLAFFLDSAAKGWFTGAVDVGGALTVAGSTTLAGTLAMSNAANRAAFAESLAQVGAGFGLEFAIASAATVDLGTALSHNVLVSGTTTITSFGSSADIDTPLYLVKFSGALVVTHNATSLVLPGLANYTTASGDAMLVELVSGNNWRVRAIWPRNASGPTVQRLTSGTGATYTAPANLKYIKGRMRGGGGGGAAQATNDGVAGGASSFGGWAANGGAGGSTSTGLGGVGGTGGANGTGTLVDRQDGQNGGADFLFASGGAGTQSGGTGGGIGGGSAIQNTVAVVAGKANTGSGGGGASGGSGGGAGEYVEFIMSAAQVGASQTYTVGALGAGGAAGTVAGANGSAGIIVIEEFYA